MVLHLLTQAHSTQQACLDHDMLPAIRIGCGLAVVSPVARLGSRWRGAPILGFPRQIVGAQGLFLQRLARTVCSGRDIPCTWYYYLGEALHRKVRPRAQLKVQLESQSHKATSHLNTPY
jgi:hypothetical protein